MQEESNFASQNSMSILHAEFRLEQQKEQAKLLAFFNIPGGKREEKHPNRKFGRLNKRCDLIWVDCMRRKAAAEYA